MRSGVLIATMAAAGCGSHLPPQPLSEGETAAIVAARTALGGRSIVVGAETPDSADRVARVLRDRGFDASADGGAGALRLDVRGPIDRTLDEPWLTIFSILPIPVWTGGTEYRMTAAAAEPVVCDTTGTIVYGPAGLFVALLPGWRSWVLYIWAGDGSSDSDARLALCAARALAAGAR